MSVPYSITPTSISAVINFTPKIIPSSHPNFEQIKKLLGDPAATEAQLIPLLDIPAAIASFTKDNIKVVNGKLFYKGFQIVSTLADLILSYVKKGQLDAAEPFKRFLERAQENPDPRAATDLYEWVVHSNLPITSDGCILAWKAVGADYMSLQSGPRGHLDHSVGNVVSEPREECDADPAVTCSRGIHFASAAYMKHYQSGGSRIMMVKIDPANVVAFPKDYNNEKGRCCELTVVGEVTDKAKVAEFYPQGRAVYRAFDAFPAAKQEKFQVGQKWKTRDGTQVEIVSIESTKHYPIRLNTGHVLTKDGQFYGDGQTSGGDLIIRI